MSVHRRALLLAFLALAGAACSSGSTTPAFPDGGSDGTVEPPPDRGPTPPADRHVGEGALRPDGPPCGNGWLDPGEACDPAIPAGQPGACPASCDDGNPCTEDTPTGRAADCSAACEHRRYTDCCGNGVRELSEECDDGNVRDDDLCTSKCLLPGGHLLISEVAVSPTTAEFIELANPTNTALPLDNVFLTDRADYHLLPTGVIKGVGSDFIARFPPGAVIKPGAFVVVALSGADFLATYGVAADFELRGTDPSTPDMLPALSNSVGASAGLTDAGELLVLFGWDGSADLVEDIDYLFWYSAASTTAALQKTPALCVDGPDADTAASCFAADTDPALQSSQLPPDSEGSLHRCDFTEGQEKKSDGNGLLGHDETSEDVAATFRRTPVKTPGDRTPGKGPPATLCAP